LALNKVLGKDFDPNGDFTHKIKPDGDIDAKYKGSKVSYDDYLSEMEHRTTNGIGKSNSIGVFGGFGKGTLKKAYEKDKNE